MGRPKAPIKRSKGIRVRLTEKEFDVLTRLSKDAGLTKSEYLRKIIKEESNNEQI